MAETIFAQATPPGRSGVAVIRISGPGAHAAARELGAGDPPLRRAVLRRLRDPRDGRVLDHALVLRFSGSASFTGEDSVELHLHGGPAVCRSVQQVLVRMPGLRPAEAGEFTRRALINGKIDLAQAEGLADLLAAETEAQAGQAMMLMEGRLSLAVRNWRRDLLEALALFETAIDFSDEDVPLDLLDQARHVLDGLSETFHRELKGSSASERLRIGYEVAIVGLPNVGKSSLINALSGREAAITSEYAGTTRDVIEVRMDLQGLPATVIDLAGLREAEDPVEKIGVQRSRERAKAADLRIFLVLEAEDIRMLDIEPRPGDLVVLAKGDLRDDGQGVSAKTGFGLADLVERVRVELETRAASASMIGHERHRQAVETALAAVRRAAGLVSMPELAAEEVRQAVRALDFLVGAMDVEAVLDVIFSRFCIGK